MRDTRKAKTSRGKKSASRAQQLTKETKPPSASKTPSGSQAKKEQASKAADAGAAPEQLDAEPE